MATKTGDFNPGMQTSDTQLFQFTAKTLWYVSYQQTLPKEEVLFLFYKRKNRCEGVLKIKYTILGSVRTEERCQVLHGFRACF
jgi:hypothetical protein